MISAPQTKSPATPVAFQEHFNLSDPRFRPVVNLNGAMTLLDRTELEIDSLLSLGLLVGFNIAVDKDSRREPRLLCASLDHYKNQNTALNLDLKGILHFMLPPMAGKSLTSVQVRRSLCCSKQLVLSLIAARALRKQPGSEHRRGNGGEASITTQSFTEFLAGRML